MTFTMTFENDPDVVRHRPDSVGVTVLEKAPLCSDINNCPSPKRVSQARLTPGYQMTWKPRLPNGYYEVLLAASWKKDPRSNQPKSSSWQFGLRVLGTLRDQPTLPKTGVEDHAFPGLILLILAGALAYAGVATSAVDQRMVARRSSP